MDRLSIAAQIVSGLFSGIPVSIEDFDKSDLEIEKKTMKEIARLSLMMADALIEESHVQIRVPSEV